MRVLQCTDKCRSAYVCSRLLKMGHFIVHVRNCTHASTTFRNESMLRMKKENDCKYCWYTQWCMQLCLQWHVQWCIAQDNGTQHTNCTTLHCIRNSKQTTSYILMLSHHFVILSTSSRYIFHLEPSAKHWFQLLTHTPALKWTAIFCDALRIRWIMITVTPAALSWTTECAVEKH